MQVAPSNVLGSLLSPAGRTAPALLYLLALLRRVIGLAGTPANAGLGLRRRLRFVLLEERTKAAVTAAEETAQAVIDKGLAVRNHVGRRRRFARDEAALRLVAQHHHELGAIVGLFAQRLVGDDDRGARQCRRPDTIEHLLRERDAVERILGVVAVVDRDRGPAQAGVALRYRGENMRADRPAGLADRDRHFDGRIEHLAAPVRRRLVGVAPYVKPLRRAADVDGDRLERE